MAIASNPGPFAGDTPNPNRNRIHRITFSIGSVKTAAHLNHRSSGSVGGYERVRDDSSDPQAIKVARRKDFITENTEEA